MAMVVMKMTSMTMHNDNDNDNDDNELSNYICRFIILLITRN